MVPLIPRRLLFGNPDRAMPQLSPDGLRLAYLAPDEGVLNVWVRTVDGDDDRPVTKDRGRGIRDYTWAEDNVHLLYIQDRDGDENWHVFRVTEAGGDDTDLTPIDGVQAHILGLDKNRPGEVLLGLNDRDPQLHDVHRFDLATGESELVMKNEIGALEWIADHELVVRIGQVPTPDGGFKILHRAAEGEEWRGLFAISPEDALNSHPIEITADGGTLVLASSAGANAAELRLLDLSSGEETVLASDPAADLHDTLLDPDTYHPQAAIFWKERKVWTVLDEAIREDVETLLQIA